MTDLKKDIDWSAYAREGGVGFTSTKLQALIEDQVRKLNDKKLSIVRERLTALGKLDYLDKAERYKFKKLMIDRHPDWEEWWLDDGTLSGHLLVTFYFRTKMDDKVDIMKPMMATFTLEWN